MLDLSKFDKKAMGKLFDHTCLGKWRTEDEIRAAARKAKEYNVACFGTSTSYWSPVVREELEGTDITAGIAIDSPFGASSLDVKIKDLEIGLKRGATCVDFVMNLGAFKGGDYQVLHDECREMKQMCGKEILTKCIIEVCYLSDDEIRKACDIIAQEGLEWAKSSSGQYDGPTLDQVRIMSETLKGSNTKVKVAGVKNPKPMNTFAYFMAGAELIGTQDAPMIIEELMKLREQGIFPAYKG